MANRRNKTRLELTWIGKEDRPKLEPRILLEDPEKSYHASVRRPDDIFDNMLIHGDNLLALKALEADFAGQVKCIYIDPPYNIDAAQGHYHDNLEHSQWLSLIRHRLEILRRLLHPQGSIWINIDDGEGHYLKVLCDEVFGRSQFVASIVWQKRTSRENRKAIGSAHDYILVYAPLGKERWKDVRHKLPPNDKGYGNPDNDPKGPWRSIPFSAQGHRKNQMYTIVTPTGKKLKPPQGRCWGATEPVFNQYLSEERVYFPKGGNGRPRIKAYKGEEQGLAPMTWWEASEAGDNQEAKKEILALFPDDESPFSTPKPERLLRRIIHIATDPGDLVLDSFAGSGTTGAVAHKLRRRWLMVELEDHCFTHVAPRLMKVAAGDDGGGVTEMEEWQGGGGFRYYRLAPSLLQKDDYGNWIINKDYNPAMLAEALCKIEGFKYAPSPETYWQQGRSTETDYIYITTQMMTADMLQKLSDEVGPDRSLLIMCKAFRSKREWANLTVKKIPKAVLSKCEWGQDDYSLEIKELPVIEDEPDETEGNAQVEPKANGKVKSKRRKAASVAGGNLFSTDETEDGGDN